MHAAGLRQRSAERRAWRSEPSGPIGVAAQQQGGFHGFKIAIAVIVFHFGVKMLVQFADILLPFIMALVLVSVLEPVKQVTLEVLECTLMLLFQNVQCCRCCLRVPRKGGGAYDSGDPVRRPAELHDLMKRLLLLISILLTVCLAGRFFWVVAHIVWLSGEAVTHDFEFYQRGVLKRGRQVQQLLHRFHLEKQADLDPEHVANMALEVLKYVAEFLTQHVFYTLTQVCLTVIFVLFLLYSPVQRDFSPVMRGVFESMELYLKLKTFISFCMGITNGIALAVIGLELPAAWGLLTFLANFIPNIGGPVMSILPCVIALLDVRKSFYQVSAAFLAQFFLHFNIANFVEPVVFGTTEKIHSVVVLLGLSFFGYIWGFTGMFLSVPLLFAMHAWLDVIVRSHSTHSEAREDARFIMGMLEGIWLAHGEAAGEESSGVSLLTGQIEATESAEASPWLDAAASLGADTSAMPASQTHLPTSQSQVPISSWQVTSELQALFAVRQPGPEAIRPVGLLLRWLLLSAAYTLAFFGFAIFHWDLASLIHSSGQPLPRGRPLHVEPVTTVGEVSSTSVPAHGLEAAALAARTLATTTLAAAFANASARASED